MEGRSEFERSLIKDFLERHNDTSEEEVEETENIENTNKIDKTKIRRSVMSPLEKCLNLCVRDIISIMDENPPKYIKNTKFNSVYALFVSIGSHYGKRLNDDSYKKEKMKNHITITLILKSVIIKNQTIKKEERVQVEEHHKRMLEKIIQNTQFYKDNYCCCYVCDHFCDMIIMKLNKFINDERRIESKKYVQTSIDKYL